ncbi:MAG: AEC family transporter [Candidatus Hodarchaeales archaeon]
MDIALITVAVFELLTELSIIYAAIIAGVIWRFSRFYKPDYGRWFTQVTIWIFFPVTILVSVLGVETIDVTVILGIALITALIHVVSYLSLLTINRLKAEEVNQNSIGAKALTATFLNALLYPFPIIIAVAGEEAIVYATFLVFFALVARNSLGVYIGIHHSPVNGNPASDGDSGPVMDARKILLEVLKFPPFLAMIAGFSILFLFGKQDISSPLVQVIKDLSMWGSLVLIGLSFQNLSQLKNLFSRDTLEVAAIRFIVSPVVALIFIVFWQFSPLISLVIMIQAMAPPAVGNIIYGKFFKIHEDEISIYITSVTFMGLLILPFELMILTMIFPV